MSTTLKLLFFGDLVGKPGQALFCKWAPRLKEEYQADGIIVNAENSAPNGRGINSSIVQLLRDYGADVITTGNHVWGQKQGLQTLQENQDRVLRPHNFPRECPGKGYTIVPIAGYEVAIVNLQGRVFMHDHLECPFRMLDSLLPLLTARTKLIFVDFHAETTSEKQGMGFYFDGKISGLFGTHTHVQTADEHILPGGTSFICDLGCSAALYSMLGMKKEIVLQRFLRQMPVKFAVEHEGPFALHAICVTVDTLTGKSLAIERIRIVDHDLTVAE